MRALLILAVVFASCFAYANDYIIAAIETNLWQSQSTNVLPRINDQLGRDASWNPLAGSDESLFVDTVDSNIWYIACFRVSQFTGAVNQAAIDDLTNTVGNPDLFKLSVTNDPEGALTLFNLVPQE